MNGQGQLEAGRELDILVATTIMGWKRVGDEDHTRPLHTTETRKRPRQAEETIAVNDWESKGPHPRLEGRYPDGDVWVHYLCACAEDDGRAGQDHHELPAYSTEMTEAWKVFEKMADRCLWRFVSSKFSDTYRCLMRDKGDRWRTIAEASTAPLAICLCALEFLEMEARANLNPLNTQS